MKNIINILFFVNGKKCQLYSTQILYFSCNVQQEQIKIATDMEKAKYYFPQMLLIHFSPI